MNVDDNNIEQLTNLSLALGYTNECIHKLLNNDNPGAGANAASSIDMTLVATDHVAELVWSPQKGLIIKCADGSICNKKPSLLWSVGPSNMATGSSSDKPTRSIDKPISKTNFMAYNLGSKVTGGDNSFPMNDIRITPFGGTNDEMKIATDDHMEGMKNEEGTSLQHKEDPRNSEGEGDAELEVIQTDQMCEDHSVSATNVGDGHRALGMDIVLASGSPIVEECQANDAKMKNSTSLSKEYGGPASDKEKCGENNTVKNIPGICPLEKLECTAENDLETPLDENATCLKTKVVALESVERIKSSSHQDDVLLPANKTLATKQSPTNSRIRRDKRGKSKALSVGNESERMLNDEDGSHESVESCNSAGLFSTGQQPWNLEQPLVVGSKRLKRQIHDSPGLALPVKQDSSFMNWISNMMKGFSQPSKGDASLLSCAVANSNHGYENLDQGFVACKKTEVPYSSSTGFRSIFQSLYCQKTKVEEPLTVNADHQTEGSKELKLDNKICDLNATPIACHMVSGNVYQRLLPSNERFNETSSGNQASPAVHSKDAYVKFAAIRGNSSSNTAENKSSVASDREKDGTSSTPSRGKHKTENAEKFDSELPSQGKIACNFVSKGELLETSWISRFTPKASGPFPNQDLSNKTTVDALDYPADALRWKTRFQNPLASSNEYENVEAMEQSTEEQQPVQNLGTAAEASFGFSKIKGQHDEKSIYKHNPVLLSPSSKNSEAIASVFARRLDALKNITPTEEIDGAARAIVTCFFCGLKGHNFQQCPEIPESELEDLLRKNNLYNWEKELSCRCIRCFQLNHWAVACTVRSSKPKNRAENDASLVNECGPSKTQIHVRNENNTELKTSGAAGALTACNRNDSGVEKDLNLPPKSNEAMNYGKLESNLIFLEKEHGPSSVEKRLKEKLMTPLVEYIDGHISDALKGIFDAIRRLRLSRADFLKWTNSHMPLSRLAGLFLRLRLGKWEEGLGGTGYYVACITGASSESSKRSIAVNVGGIQFLVESQYISNHDFLEDELVVWWSATSRSGGKLPSEEELRVKVEEKKMLGF